MDVDQRRARREARRRERARRRAWGLAAVAVVSIAAFLMAGLVGSGSSPKSVSQNRASTAAGPVPGTGRSPSAGAAGIASGKPGVEPVPILMYHVINPPPAGAKFPGLYVSPEEFAAQMRG